MDFSTISAMIPGPWGIVLGIGITILGQYLRGRLGWKPAPAPPAAPDSPTPKLDALLEFLRVHLGTPPAAPVAKDLTHEAAADMLAKLLPPAK